MRRPYKRNIPICKKCACGKINKIHNFFIIKTLHKDWDCNQVNYKIHNNKLKCRKRIT